jgi:hypothetical protein
MHNQSDYGYSSSGIEVKTRAMCARRARSCLSASRRDPEARPYYASDSTHRQMAAAWVAEGRHLPRAKARSESL